MIRSRYDLTYNTNFETIIWKFFSPVKYYEYTCHKVQESNIFKVDAHTISSSRLLISHRHSKPFKVLHQRSLNETFADKGNLFPLLTEP